MDLPIQASETIIDNGDGTYRVERPAVAGWLSGYSVVTPGPPPPPLPWWRRALEDLGDWWFDIRCWLAENVLRVGTDRGDW